MLSPMGTQKSGKDVEIIEGGTLQNIYVKELEENLAFQGKVVP